MKKTTKRILCGALSLTMLSSLVLERALSTAETPAGITTTASATFKNVTGQFDTTALREKYFSDAVLKNTDVQANYETRNVIVTLEGDNLVERADGELVSEYVSSRDGKREADKIAAEQDRFLIALQDKGISYKLVRSYDTVLNGVAITVDTAHVASIKKMSGVESVVITTSYAEPATATTVSTDDNVVTNETKVYDTGIYDSSEYTEEYGEGMVVAVLDTGLDYTHVAFQDFQHEGVQTRWSKADVKKLMDDKNLNAEQRSTGLEVNDVYMNEKVPYTFDYADDDPDVYPSYSNHGTHVAGIIGGYSTAGYTDKDGNVVDEPFIGVVPDAQLAIFKVFTDDLDDPDLGGAVSEDIVAALDDCVKLGVDVINMSLGTSAGFTTTDDGDDEGEMLNAVYESVKASGISLVCAASNDFSAGYGGVYGTNLASNPDSGTVGSPSTFAAALSVASVNGQPASYMIANEENATKRSYVFYEESRDINSNPFDFYKTLNEKYPENNGEFEYVVVPGIGQAADYSMISDLFKVKDSHGTGRIALVKRGDSTFQEKVEVAKQMGAIAIIVYNNVAGVIRMNLGEVNDPIPAVSINMNAGNAMVKGATSRVGTISLDPEQKAGPFMSEFSSWGPTHDLGLKPEITAHGGEITSTVPGGYGEQSGTSMASPNMAGFMAIVRSYIKKNADIAKEIDINNPVEVNRLAMQLVMSTATTAYDQDGHPYSPRKQGAGLARMEKVIDETKAYLSTDVVGNDYRPKLELGEDEKKTGVYEMTFKVSNFGSEALRFTTDQLVMTETLSSDNLTVSEQAYMLDDKLTVWKVGGERVETGGEITVPAGGEKEITVTITLTDGDKEYIDKSFENGMYVEGYLKLVSASNTQCDLSIPFLAFYGDWEAAPMLDYTAFEIAENEQDASVKEEDKIKASVWATLPYATYYNEKYILPMGTYLYTLPDDADPVYVDEDKCSVSRYNIYYGEGEARNFMTSTSIKAVYAGLLRNARAVKYRLYDETTGELVLEDKLDRIGKAYAGGGSAVPGNVDVELDPEAAGLMANGTYRMEFDFFMDGDAYKDENGNYLKDEDGGKIFPDRAKEENTYEFSFTVDYEAPILQDARVRYYNYKENNKEKQRIYLDIDVYDNHYAQTVMLCYPKTDKNGEISLMLATDYPTPVRDGKRNGTTTVSIEITDIYEKYGSELYVQLDDYAINSCLYKVDIAEANKDSIADVKDFDFVTDNKLTKDARGDGQLTLNIYETYKVGLTDVGSGNASNFTWSSTVPGVATVKNGEIVGLNPGTAKIRIKSATGMIKEIKVTVTDQKESIVTVPSISFGLIKTNTEALTNAVGVVKVNAGESFNIPVKTDPWYHPMPADKVRIVWTSSDEKVATVDDEGNVSTLKKGTAIISAVVEEKRANGKWEASLYSESVTLRVQNEFTVSNFTLTEYNGVGGVVEIPKDLNVMYIGEEAFKDNDNITKLIIPSTVSQIQARAFLNCTALKEVYFVSEEHREDGATDKDGKLIDWAELSMIYENAFTGCINLEKIDFSNVKTITVATSVFEGCSKLSEVVDMPSIGTMHHRAFAGTALTSVDLTGLHMSGSSVFANCTKLETIKTGKFTAIGNYMFDGCTGLSETVTLATPKIGDYAFRDCVNLAGVKLDDNGAGVEYSIGAGAFKNCGKNAGGFTVNFNGETVRVIGDGAFAGSAITSFAVPAGLEVFGGDVFSGTSIKSLTIDNNVNVEALRFSGIPFRGMTLQLAQTNSDDYALENGVLYNADKTKILHVNPEVTELTVLDTVSAIAAYALAGSNVARVKLGENVTALGTGAFEGSALAEMDFNGASLTEIPESAFRSTKLSSITLPESVKKVGAYAFANSSLSAFAANGLEEIGSYAFRDCTALRGVQTGDNYQLTLHDEIKTMGDGVFQGCTALTHIVMPSLDSLGTATFAGATALKEVTFGRDAKTVGTYTFVDSYFDYTTGQFIFTEASVEKVVIGELTETIGEAAFYNCTALTEITLPAVTKVEAYAFSNCKKLTKVNGIEQVKTIGNESFYDVPFATLNLESATTIGVGAFARATAQRSDLAGVLNLPMAENVERLAFHRSSFNKVVFSETLRTLGHGAFAEMNNLSTIEGGDNKLFFVEDGVLYRNVIKTDLSGNESLLGYEVVCYPAALEAPLVDGVRTYTVKEDTLRVNAYAFYGLSEGVIDEVILPYTVNAIGDSAFFASGIKEYTFESIQAPVLEVVFRQEVLDYIEKYSEDKRKESYYKGYYHANFETYLYTFTEYGNAESKLVINYPANGVGYNNYIYNLYFGVKNVGDVLPEDNTRIFLTMMDNFPKVNEIEGWKNLEVTDENKAMVEAFAAEVKTARRYFNNATKQETQAAFVENYAETLRSIEETLRSVKSKFGIVTKLAEIRVASDSTHRTNYAEGETFDMTGLKIELVYDDESTEIADIEDVKLKTDNPLTPLNKLVTIECKGKRLSISVKVKAAETEDSSGGEDSSSVSGGCGGCGGVASGAVAAMAVLVMGAVCLKGKKDE